MGQNDETMELRAIYDELTSDEAPVINLKANRADYSYHGGLISVRHHIIITYVMAGMLVVNVKEEIEVNLQPDEGQEQEGECSERSE